MPAPELLEVGDLSDEVIQYCQGLANILSVRPGIVRMQRSASSLFDAKVKPAADGTYRVLLNDGTIQKVRETAIKLADAPGIDEEMADRAEELLGSAEFSSVTYGSWVAQVLIFIGLHEVAHVLCGHFSVLPLLDGNVHSEVAGPDLPIHQPGWEDHRLRWLLELEADEVALDRMLALAFEIFTADGDVRDLYAHAGRSTIDVAGSVRRSAERLTFHAACSAIALLEAGREPLGTGHPPAFARMLYLSNVFLLRQLDASGGPPGVTHLRFSADQQRTFRETFIPAVLEAMIFANACCETIGVDLASRFGHPGETPLGIAGILATDLVAVVAGRPTSTLSAEAAQYREISQLFEAYNPKIRPYRLFAALDRDDR
ncbi:MAG TPA: hypothetical protein VHM31_12400 [Polyangia bacterium]|nr:hypothetical protein [Polyangia bacterium]